MLNIVSIFSAIGNNSTLTPIVIKDNIENTGKAVLAYNQGNKVSKEVGFYEARENVIEEFGTSAVWLAAPIAVKKVYDNLIIKNLFGFKNFANVDLKLLNGKNYQTLKNNIQSSTDSVLKSDAEKILKNTTKFKVLTWGKSLAAIGITLGLLFKLTDFKQKVTKDSIKSKGLPQGFDATAVAIKKNVESNPAFKSFIHKKQDIHFKGIGTALCIDSGIGAYRIESARNKAEAKEYIFKTLSFLTFCYAGGVIVEKMIEGIAHKLKMPIKLDPIILSSKEFTESVQQAVKDVSFKKKFLEFAQITESDNKFNTEKKIIDFIDDQIKNGMKIVKKGGQSITELGFENATLEFARQLKLIDVVDGARNVTKFIDTDAIHSMNKNFVEFIEHAPINKVENFVKSMKFAKCGSIGANIVICSLFTAYLLPKVQYLFREKSIQSVSFPGLNSYKKIEA